MKNYETPKCELLRIMNEDVLASSPLTDERPEAMETLLDKAQDVLGNIEIDILP